MDLEPGQHVFFIGIGGISMSGLAQALMQLGYTVSGSDISEGSTTHDLVSLGIDVCIGHDSANVVGADAVVYTTAIPEDNPELVAAREAGLPIYHRSELLAWVCRNKHTVAVTGTHGKSTTTAMLATILIDNGMDPTVFVGAQFPAIDGNARLGHGDYAVFEACESDCSFLNYEGCSQIITSCEADHLDQHEDFDHLKSSFEQFARRADPDGVVVYNADSDVVCAIVEGSPAEPVGFSIAGRGRICAHRVDARADGTSFELSKGGKTICEAHLPTLGIHNVQNALAAMACAEGLGVDLSAAANALKAYQPVGRRFERIGHRNGVQVIDDYAHHPTEIIATLAAARQSHSGRLIAVFQPHLRSRTRDLLDEFAAAFDVADVVILTDIYQPRQDGLGEFDISILGEELKRHAPEKPVRIIRDKDDIPARIGPMLESGDLVLTVGAGDIDEIAPRLLAATDEA